VTLLSKTLSAFAVHSLPDLGYTQSLNYIMGFLLMVTGAEEEASYELFTKLMDRDIGVFRFYTEGFPLYFEFLSILDTYLSARHSNLYQHMLEIGFLHAMWF